MVRMKSPPLGSSTLITSAPCSPNTPAQKGAEIRVPTSTTRIPSRGLIISTAGSLVALVFGEHFLHRPLLLAGLQRRERGVGVGHELVDHEVVLPRLSLAHGVEGVVDRVFDGLGGDRR